jgi:hypothetical protein
LPRLAWQQDAPQQGARHHQPTSESVTGSHSQGSNSQAAERPRGTSMLVSQPLPPCRAAEPTPQTNKEAWQAGKVPQAGEPPLLPPRASRSVKVCGCRGRQASGMAGNRRNQSVLIYAKAEGPGCWLLASGTTVPYLYTGTVVHWHHGNLPCAPHSCGEVGCTQPSIPLKLLALLDERGRACGVTS